MTQAWGFQERFNEPQQHHKVPGGNGVALQGPGEGGEERGDGRLEWIHRSGSISSLGLGIPLFLQQVSVPPLRLALIPAGLTPSNTELCR